MWTPTIYTGVLGALALLTYLIRLRRDGIDAWWMIAILGLLLSFGHFGFAWLVQQIPGALNGVDSAIGGPYWILHQWLPGYDSFRYPTKWLPVFALATSILVTKCVDEITLTPARYAGARFAFTAVVIAAVIGLAAVSFFDQQAGPTKRVGQWKR